SGHELWFVTLQVVALVPELLEEEPVEVYDAFDVNHLHMRSAVMSKFIKSTLLCKSVSCFGE
ncbi:hypothetical protein, partial [Salmonella sp. s51933]|uniref:hypothetical protein n=1 Tax=Salmonella sp. s51933 TaxID=3160127 RepID=UPI0037549304